MTPTFNVLDEIQNYTDLSAYTLCFLDFETYRNSGLHKIHGYERYFRANPAVLEELSIDEECEDSNPDLNLIKCLFKFGKDCSTNAMDNASRNGHLAVVKYLHSIKKDCTTRAMNWASDRGHLAIVEYLHSIGKGCTTDAMDDASRAGHLEVVK